MFIIPYTYSLGREDKFAKLAAIARKNKEWRKVARMINKYNRINGRMSFTRNENPNTYLVRATLDTHLTEETRQAIYETFELTSRATRYNLLGIY